MNYRMALYSFIISAAISSIATTASPDTVYLENGEEQKGIVVENYNDRIVLSTVDGEKEIKKQDIRDILYDMTEQNLVKLGDFHQQKGNLIRAYAYYSKAYKLNPGYKEAQDKFIHIRSILLRRPEQQLIDDMDRKRTLFKESGKVYKPSITEEISNVRKEDFIKMTGITLVWENDLPKVENVLASSPAERDGIKKGDFIFTVWGKLTGYYDLDAIIDMILNSPSPEVLLSIKRKVIFNNEDKKLPNFNSIGFSLDMQEEGLTVSNVKKGSLAQRQGLSENDLIVAINGNSTRYMPLKDAAVLIEKYFSKIGILELDIIRDITLWRSGKDGYH